MYPFDALHPMTGYQPYKQLFYIWYQPTSCNFPLPSSASGFSALRTQKKKRSNSIYGQHTRLIIDCKVAHTVTTAAHAIFSPNILYTSAEPRLPNVYIDDTYSQTKGEYGIDSCQRQKSSSSPSQFLDRFWDPPNFH